MHLTPRLRHALTRATRLWRPFLQRNVMANNNEIDLGCNTGCDCKTAALLPPRCRRCRRSAVWPDSPLQASALFCHLHVMYSVVPKLKNSPLPLHWLKQGKSSSELRRRAVCGMRPRATQFCESDTTTRVVLIIIISGRCNM